MNGLRLNGGGRVQTHVGHSGLQRGGEVEIRKIQTVLARCLVQGGEWVSLTCGNWGCSKKLSDKLRVIFLGMEKRAGSNPYCHAAIGERRLFALMPF